MPEDLREKTALVTGGARRIGRAICLRLASEGARVVLSYRRSEAEARETAREIESRGGRALAVPADLSRAEDLERLVREAQGFTGAVDILVNNASDFAATPAEALASDPREFERAFDRFASVHVRAPLYLGLRLGLEMKRRGWGRVVNVADRVPHAGRAYRNWSLYLVTKYGLEGVTRVLAVELAPEVAVNAVAPGLAVPPEGMAAEEVERLARAVPLEAPSGPEEIAEDVLYLIRSDFKTGSTIVSDGGAGLRA